MKDLKTTITAVINLIALIGCLVALIRGQINVEDFTIVMGTVSSVSVTVIGVLAKDSEDIKAPQKRRSKSETT